MTIKNHQRFPVIIYGSIFIFALVFLFLATQFKQPYGDTNGVGSSFYPITATLILSLLCISQLVMELRSSDQASSGTVNSFWPRALMVFAVLVIYGFGIELIGYLPATVTGFTAILFLLGVRRWSWYLSAPIFSFVLYYIFSKIFMVFLPTGFLFQ